MTPTVFVFDMNSLFGRTFKVQADNDKTPNRPDATYLNQPVFCLKPLFNMFQSEMRTVRELGYDNTHIVLVFDHPGKNFRYDIYKDYKGNRDPHPEAWLIQEQLMFEMFKSLGFPCLRIDWVEADDVIGTITHKLSLKKINSVIFTGDKDLLALCNDVTHVYAGAKKRLFKERDVFDFMGVPPSRVVDYLTLDGDKADNIPGVKGVGKKSACGILNKYTLDEVVGKPELIEELDIRNPARIRKLIENGKEEIDLSRRLVSLKLDVSLGMNLNQMKRKAPDYDAFLDGYMRPSMDM